MVDWDEPPSNIVLQYDPVIGKEFVVAGTLDGLIQWLTPTHSSDMDFRNVFLYTYTTFITHESLLEKLKQRFATKSGEDCYINLEEKKIIKLRVIFFLKKWLEVYILDFGQEFLEKISIFLAEIKKIPEYFTFAVNLESILSKKSLETKKISNQPPSVLGGLKSELKFLQIDSKEFAKQMTLRDFEMFSCISHVEFLHQNFGKNKLRCPNLTSSLRIFANTALWVSSLILTEPDQNLRVQIVVKLIVIANHLRYLNNFNGVFAIVLGLNSNGVYRLKSTIERIPVTYSEMLKDLLRLVDRSAGFKVYREVLRNTHPPVVPYLGLFLYHISFIEDGANSTHFSDFINFRKRNLLCNVIMEVLQYRKVGYDIQRIPVISEYLANINLIEENEEDLFQLSLELEPRH